MSPAPYRAIRFINAGGAPAGGGLAVTATGALATVAGDESVRQAIQLLLATSPGERLMRPQYGSHLHRLAFAPNDDTTAGLAIHYVREAVERWEPRVDILDVDAGADPLDPALLLISLRYRVRANHRTELIEYRLDPQTP